MRLKTNWRVGAENASTPHTSYIHRDSPLIPGNKLMLPIGSCDHEAGNRSRDRFRAEGIYDKMARATCPSSKRRFGGKKSCCDRAASDGEKIGSRPTSRSGCRACSRSIRSGSGAHQFEWYVPGRRRQAHVLARLARRAEDCGRRATRSGASSTHTWKTLALAGFNDSTSGAREGLEESIATTMPGRRSISSSPTRARSNGDDSPRSTTAAFNPCAERSYAGRR